ncbi:MAG TPA: WD40 repeat domain-containing protein, partial [Actinomycetota bacterium]|nr:WD40 repeat domain-containing protein [Actinomycetota bacterium]
MAGSRLEQFETWRATSGLSITPLEHEYLEASVAERERRRAEEKTRLARERALERRAIRRLRAFVAVLSAAAIVAAGLSVFASNQRGRARREASIAASRELSAEAVASLNEDPELSILLSIEAVRSYQAAGVPIGKDSVEALHRAVQAVRIVRTIRGLAGGGAQFSPDGAILATYRQRSFGTISETGSTDIVLWDAATGERLRTLTGHTARIIDSEFSPDGSLLVTASGDNSAIVWDIAAGRPRMTLKEAHDGLISASFGPRGDRVATSGVDGILKVWEVETGEEMLSIQVGSPVGGNKFSPDGKLLASGIFGGNYRAQVWDAQTGEEVRTFPHDLAVTSVAFSPDGSRLATASFDGRARVWDLRTGRELAVLEGHTGWLWYVTFSPDGSRVATGSADSTARVWEARTGKQLLVLSGHRASVGNVSFNPDGTRLATGSDDGTARIWDITPEGNREVVTIAGQTEFTTNVAYTPDGTRLLVPEEEGMLGVWDASTGRLVRRLAFDKGVFD